MYSKFWDEAHQEGTPFPSSSQSLVYFAAWLSKRGVLKQTIQQYLSAVRNEDELLGFGDQSRKLDLLLRRVANVRATEEGSKEAKAVWERAGLCKRRRC